MDAKTRTQTTSVSVSEQEARSFAEDARETEREHQSFVYELYKGNLRLDLIHPHPTESKAELSRAQPFLEKLQAVLENIDPDEIERERKIPQDVINELKEIGAFGIKIPTQYGGLGLSQRSYVKAIGMVTSVDASLTCLLSAHQSIGVPQPLLKFGTQQQKDKYLPQLAQGAVSAFALTEPNAGSDPANISTHADLSDDGESYILNGEKLWITNGSIAELLVVMARTEAGGITAFIVETDWPGVEVAHRCDFMGLKGAEIGWIRFSDVSVPKENMLWKEGLGLKLALITLNTGRLSLPMGAAYAAKRAVALSRDWANRRVQWGRSIGKHDAIAQKIGRMAADTFALESVAELSAALSERDNYDIRLEAAMAKLYNSESFWNVIDDALQIRGGRGYETQASMKARGEDELSIEKFFRDARILRIFEGTSEIMRLFIAREAVDMHLTIAGDLINPKLSLKQKLKSFVQVARFYSTWYPSLWLGWGHWPRHSEFGKLARHVCYLDRNTRRLARSVFHCMIRFGGGLEKQQAVLGRLVDIGSELYAMAAVCTRAHAMHQKQSDRQAIKMANVFCRLSQRRVDTLFKQLFHNDDKATYALAKEVLNDKHQWLETGLPQMKAK